MTRQYPERPALYALASSNFAVGSMSYGIVGLLPGVISDWHISTGHAARLIAVYSLTFAVGAPVLQILIGHLRRRDVLIGGLFLMGTASICGMSAPSFGWLVAMRVVAGLGAAAVSPFATAIGTSIAPPERQGRALATVFVGVTLSGVISAPLSAAIAHWLGWRWVFGLLALVSLGSAAWIGFRVRDTSCGVRLHPFGLVQLVAQPAIMGGLGVALLQTAAFFSTFTLILPLLRTQFGVSTNHGALALFVFGLSGVLGNIITQRISDRWPVDRMLAVAMGSMLLVFGGITVARFLPLPSLGQTLVVLPLLIVWALMQDLFYPSQLRRIVYLDIHHRGMLLALNSSSILMGISLGATLGGHIADHWSIAALPTASAAITLIAMACLFASRRFSAQLRKLS
ncbi:MFS transporter [Burkholderia sp. SRS-46]|nr:MFS transporter [Burkholderia sp. SRS-46]